MGWPSPNTFAKTLDPVGRSYPTIHQSATRTHTGDAFDSRLESVQGCYSFRLPLALARPEPHTSTAGGVLASFS
ncbi:hypothetical protein ZHAS_00018994 [Anopheles sinensis]|uniref:Uncharacterized protein n=1 Tax=Anopheles sinensis TaxID=74873 RepID=A0A084WL59_ANOSI|nr:hypothetical protein ZHAS_00018994 [Anopheles sinensis]